MKNITTFIFLVFAINLSFSQTTPKDKVGAWYMFDATHKVTNKLSIKSGVQLRSFEVLDNINLLFLYTGINYHLNKKTTLTLAYCFLDIDRSFIITGESHLYENRPYEQISYKQKLFKHPIQHRLRLEQRFINFQHNQTTILAP